MPLESSNDPALREALVSFLLDTFRLTPEAPFVQPALLRWKYDEPRPDWSGPRAGPVGAGLVVLPAEQRRLDERRLGSQTESVQQEADQGLAERRIVGRFERHKGSGARAPLAKTVEDGLERRGAFEVLEIDIDSELFADDAQEVDLGHRIPFRDPGGGG